MPKTMDTEMRSLRKLDMDASVAILKENPRF
jgi:hypothetical protein